MNARAILEAETPKSIFRALRHEPPPVPPQDLVRKAIRAKEIYLGAECTKTAVHTNKQGETFLFGKFGSGERGTISTLLYYELHKGWRPIGSAVESGWEDPLREYFDGLLCEAENPKKTFRSVTQQQKWKQTEHKKFRMDSGWDVEEHYFERDGWTLYVNKVNENPTDQGGFYWRVGLKAPGEDGWRISGTLSHANGELFWGVPLEQILPRVFKWGNRNLSVDEAESPKEIFKRFPRGPNIADGKQVSGAYLRRLLGHYFAKNVYVWKQEGKFPHGEGILQIDLQNWGLIREEWASYDMLLDRLKTWRNLQGAPLWINGRPAGKVGKTLDQQ